MKKCLRSAFTMIEVMFAVVFLGIVMVGAYELVGKSGYVSRLARDHYVAIHLCNNRLERARNFAFDNIYLLAESNLVMNANGSPDPSGNFRRTMSVTRNISPNLTRVIITVEVRDVTTMQFNGTNKESIATYFTRYVDRPGAVTP